MNFKVLISAILASMIAIVGCSDDTGDGGTAGSGGSGGDGGTAWVPIADCDAIAMPTGYSIEGAPATATDDCDTTLSATGTNDAAAINAAVELAISGSVICLESGAYDMEETVTVTSVANLTIKGKGPSPDDVKLDYKGRGVNGGFDVETDGFTIENMWIVNTAANGVVVKAADSVFRKLYVTWDAGSVQENGAYSVYPTSCENTLVEYVEVAGASDAGLYVGQCVGGIVRYNKVYANVAGLEVENSKDVEVYGNDVFNNAGGLLALQEPNLQRLANENILMRDNFVYCNNHVNFARPNTTVANIPSGTGTMSFAGDGIEIRDNIMDSNDSTAMLLVSNALLCQIAGDDCNAQPGYNRYPEQIYVHDNTYINNGTDPQGIVGDIALITGTPTPEVIWDGYINPATTDPEICLGDPVTVTYIDLTQDQCQAVLGDDLTLCIAGNFTLDPAGRNCTLDPVVIP